MTVFNTILGHIFFQSPHLNYLLLWVTNLVEIGLHAVDVIENKLGLHIPMRLELFVVFAMQN